MPTLSRLLPHHARYRGDAPALDFEGQCRDFASLNGEVNRLANALLAFGLKQGDRFATGPLVMPGYHNRRDLTAKAFHGRWLRSGDLGYLDEDGYLFLVDRAKDMIISGGVNVYPRDIEEIVIRHPAVNEVAVFGAEDSKWGEAPVAAVTITGDVTSGELVEWVNQRVDARFQRIPDALILDEFPRNVAGKILKRELRENYTRGKED